MNPDTNTSAALVPIRDSLTTDQIELLKTTICRGATDDELKLFINVCNKTRLDPFSRQIHAVKRWNSQSRREEMSIQIGIDGFRLTAQRSEQLDGQDGPYWCGPDGKWVDVWLEASPPAAAKVIVFRKGCAHPFTGIARYDAYVQKNKEGYPNRIWATMPDIMTAKCAEALALRKAFPAELSGIYAPEEMGQADNPEPTHKPALTDVPTEPEEIISEWDKATPASIPATPSPAPEKPASSQPQAIKRATNLTVHWALEQLKALDGEPNRPVIKAFLIAAGAIRNDQEPENWRLEMVPVTPGQLRELGVAIANFDRGDKAVIPYAPKQSPWGEYVVPFGKFKDHKLKEVPEDVQKWFFHNFKLAGTWEKVEADGSLKTYQKTEANKLKDRDFREALDAMGQSKGFTKEETTP